MNPTTSARAIHTLAYRSRSQRLYNTRSQCWHPVPVGTRVPAVRRQTKHEHVAHRGSSSQPRMSHPYCRLLQGQWRRCRPLEGLASHHRSNHQGCYRRRHCHRRPLRLTTSGEEWQARYPERGVKHDDQRRGKKNRVDSMDGCMDAPRK